MITAMRRNLKALSVWLWVVIAAFIGTTFLVWGKGSITGGDSTAVATVNGEEIPLDRYQRRQQAYQEFYRQLYRDRFTAALATRLGLHQQVLDDLIREELVTQQARAEGITVGDDELIARIHAIRAFQQGGRFSLERYEELLRRERFTRPAFEKELRGEMLLRKVEALIKAGIKVSEAELRQAYDLKREKVRATWVLVELSPFLAKADASEQEIQAYLREHQAEFQRPERRRVQYLVVSSKGFPQQVSDAEVAAYYKDRANEFELPQRVRAAHILVRVPEVGGSEAEQKSRAKVEEIIRRARAGEDFAKLAREVSEDPGSAGKGGDLGYVARGELIPPLEQALFALKKGEISPGPVRSGFGYHAMKVLDLQEADKRPLREVAREIREKLQTERSDRAALAKAEEVKPLLQAGKDFALEAWKLGLQPKEATVARGGALDGVGPDPAVEESIFSLAVGGVSSPLKTAAGYVLLKVSEHLPAAVPPLAQIKEEVAGAVKRPKAEAQTLEQARALALAVTKGEDLLALAAKEGLPSGDTGLFSRAEPPKDPKLPVEIPRRAQETALGAVSEPVKTSQGVYLVKTLERRPPDPAGFEKERAEIEKQVLEEKQREAWESWIVALRSRAKIQVLSQNR
jgi:peptidyl-prolyl cis-trans isomerase D